MSQGQTELFKIGLRQLRQNVSLDFAVAKPVLILT